MSMESDPQHTERVWTVGGVPFNVRVAVIITLATILPIINHYHNVAGLLGGVWEHLQHRPTAHAYDQVLFYFLIPMLVIVLGFRESPKRYGFCFGKWREGLLWTLAVCPPMLIALWFVVRYSDMQTYYAWTAYGRVHGMDQVDSGMAAIPTSAHLAMAYQSTLALVPWEFLWRGFVLFGLARVIGPGPAIFVQAMPFALLHIGKPEIETITTIFGGVGFGFVAWRTDSFLYAFIIHWVILVFTNLAAVGVFG